MDARGYVRPEFGCGVARESPNDAKSGAFERVLSVGFAVGAPGVREKTAPGDCNVTRVGRAIVTGGAARKVSEHHSVAKAFAERAIRDAKIPGIFVPDRSKARFHGVTGGEPSEAHPVALPVAAPVAVVFVGLIFGGSEGGWEQS